MVTAAVLWLEVLRPGREMAGQKLGPLAMSWLCKIGLHRTVTKEATARKGTFVSRCMCCAYVKVAHRRGKRAGAMHRPDADTGPGPTVGLPLKA